MKTPRSRWNAFCVLLLAVSFSLIGTAVAQNQYYVAPTGSDSNDGSKAHPWATINHADAALTVGAPGVCTAGSGWISASGVGACVHVASGSYAQAVNNSKAGTAPARVRYVSDTKYGARLLGVNGAGVIWTNHGAYTDIVGFDIDGSTTDVQSGIITYYDNGPSGCHSAILSNKVHDLSNAGGAFNAAGGMGTGGNSLYDLPSPCGVLYQGNLIYHNNGGGSNTFAAGNTNAAMSFAWGDIAQNNIVMDQGGLCLSPTHTSSNLIITNNIIMNCSQGGIEMANTTGGVNDYSTVTNNIIINSGAVTGNGGIRAFHTGGCGSHNVYANNLMYGNVGGNYVFDTGCANLSSNTLSGSNSTTFVNYTGTISGDYHLKAGSAAIGGGTTACAVAARGCAPSVDFEGNARLQAPDIGSYAFAATGAPGAPTGLTASVQ